MGGRNGREKAGYQEAKREESLPIKAGIVTVKYKRPRDLKATKKLL